MSASTISYERNTLRGRELHPLKSSGFHGVLYRQLPLFLY